MKVVLDTNVYVAACFGGHAALLMQAWETGRLRLVVSQPMIQEHETILERHPKASKVLREAWQALWKNREHTEWLHDIPWVGEGWCKDSSDDKFIAAAFAGSANYLITADKLLLCLNPINGLEVMHARRFVERHLHLLPC